MRNTLCQLTEKINKMVTVRNRDLSFKDIMYFLSRHVKSNSNTIANNDLKIKKITKVSETAIRKKKR
jgi:hypothetical protein